MLQRTGKVEESGVGTIAKNPSQVGTCPGVVGLQAHGVLKGGASFLPFPLPGQHDSQVRVRCGVTRIDLNGLLKGSDGLVQLLLPMQRAAEADEGTCTLWIEFDGRAIGGGRL